MRRTSGINQKYLKLHLIIMFFIFGIIILTSNSAKAQCVIYSTDKYGGNITKVGTIRNDIIYSTDKYGGNIT